MIGVGAITGCENWLSSMGQTTQISWADHTFNPWWGCTKIAPGCDNCYAAAFDKRFGGNHWIDSENRTGDHPRLTSDQNWRQPMKWNRVAVEQGQRRRVFCGSMMDWCDKNAPEGALDRLFEVIRSTPMLDWLLLTKRATLIKKRLPSDWGTGYDNVWLGVTVEDFRHGIPRLKELSKIPAKVRFLSCEPLLEDIASTGIFNLDNIDWVIIGGESGPGYRAMHSDWAVELIYQCRRQSVPVWFKQWGGNNREKGGHLVFGWELKELPVREVSK